MKRSPMPAPICSACGVSLKSGAPHDKDCWASPPTGAVANRPGWRILSVVMGVALLIAIAVMLSSEANSPEPEGRTPVDAQKPLVPTLAVDPNVATINAESFGERWPLTVLSGELKCENEAIIFTAPDGQTYGVNGTALTLGLPRIDPIWATSDDPTEQQLGIKKSLSPLFDRARTLCLAHAGVGGTDAG